MHRDLLDFFVGMKNQLFLVAPKAGLGILVFFLFWFLAILLSKIVSAAGHRLRIHASVVTLLGRTLHIVLVLFGVVAGLAVAGVDVSALVASLGLTGFALGFALRDALSNILAGALIIIYRPFRKGDQISVTGFEGEVQTIDLRYTTLRTEDRKILIPNQNLFTNPVIVLKPKNTEHRA